MRETVLSLLKTLLSLLRMLRDEPHPAHRSLGMTQGAGRCEPSRARVIESALSRALGAVD